MAALPAPDPYGDRRQLLLQRAHLLPRAERQALSVRRLLLGLVLLTLAALTGGLLGQALAEGDAAVAALSAVVLLPSVAGLLQLWRSARRSQARWRQWQQVGDDGRGAPADVPLEARRLADAQDDAEREHVLSRELLSLQFATAKPGELARVLGVLPGGAGLIALLGGSAGLGEDSDAAGLALAGLILSVGGFTPLLRRPRAGRAGHARPGPPRLDRSRATRSPSST